MAVRPTAMETFSNQWAPLKLETPEYEVEMLENSWRNEVFRLVNTAEEQYTHVSGSGRLKSAWPKSGAL